MTARKREGQDHVMAGKDEGGRLRLSPRTSVQIGQRRERLAAALRETLRRRKRQARARAERGASSPKDDQA